MIKLKAIFLIVFIVSGLMCSACQGPSLKSSDLQAPLLKKYTAVYKVEDPSVANKVRYETYSSDGNGHLRTSADDDLFQLFDCKQKRVYRACTSKHVYCYVDKTIDSCSGFALPEIVDESGLQNEIPDVESVANVVQLNRNPEHDLKLGLRYKQHAEPKEYLGSEIIDGHKCRHFKTNTSMQVSSSLWYCPELNCCVKYTNCVFGALSQFTLFKYSPNCDEKLFDLSKFRKVPCAEFEKETAQKE